MTKTVLIILLSFIPYAFSSNVDAQKNSNLEGSISISGAFALYPLAVKWAEEFKKIHSKVNIDVSAGGAGKGITDVLFNMTDIALVSRDINVEEVKKGAYAIAVTKDAVVPTISANNPLLKELLLKGIKKEALNNIFIEGKYKQWEQATGIKSKLPLRAYTRSDAGGAAETWAKYFGKKQEDLEGVAVFGDPGLALAVKKDPSAIGFNNLVYIYDLKTKKQTNGVIILPIDLNNNGKIDQEENFYDTIDQLTIAIADGRYPSPPARDLYFVTKDKPRNKITIEFIKWVLSDGQKYVREGGYIQLDDLKIKNELKKLQ